MLQSDWKRWMIKWITWCSDWEGMDSRRPLLRSVGRRNSYYNGNSLLFSLSSRSLAAGEGKCWHSDAKILNIRQSASEESHESGRASLERVEYLPTSQKVNLRCLYVISAYSYAHKLFSLRLIVWHEGKICWIPPLMSMLWSWSTQC